MGTLQKLQDETVSEVASPRNNQEEGNADESVIASNESPTATAVVSEPSESNDAMREQATGKSPWRAKRQQQGDISERSAEDRGSWRNIDSGSDDDAPARGGYRAGAETPLPKVKERSYDPVLEAVATLPSKEGSPKVDPGVVRAKDIESFFQKEDKPAGSPR